MIRNRFARQPVRNRLPATWHTRSASEDGKRNPYACTEVVQTLDRYWNGTPAAF